MEWWGGKSLIVLNKKLARENSKHAFRSQRQQHEAPALELDDVNLIEDVDTNLIESKYNDLIDGVHEKTIYVKTWKRKTISVETDLKHTMEIVKRRIETKTRIPMDDQHLVAGGRVLLDNIPLKEYGKSGGETIELTVQLLGGVKHKVSVPNQWIPKERKKEKNLNHTLMWEVLKVKSHKQILMKKVVANKKWMSEAMREQEKCGGMTCPNLSSQ